VDGGDDLLVSRVDGLEGLALDAFDKLVVYEPVWGRRGRLFSRNTCK
jgi:hypothetical protein